MSDGSAAAPMVDTVAVSVPVEVSVPAALGGLSGRRLILGSGGDVEVDSPRIGKLPGSYDPNLWVQFYDFDGPTLRIEGSPHRHILGHNVFGGPGDLVACARYMIEVCRAWIGVELPEWQEWRLNRVDLAWAFKADSELAAHKFIRDQAVAWQTTTAARSLPRSYGTSVYADRVVLYGKGAEIRKHGRPSWMSNSEFYNLLNTACELVRAEVRYRRRDIERLTFSGLGKVEQERLVENAREKLSKFGRTTSESMETVRTIETVKDRLAQLHSPMRAAALMGTWFSLTTVGERVTRNGMKRTTFFRHVKELKDAGVAWTGTDVMRCEPALYGGLVLSAWSPACVRGVDPRVQSVLAPFAA